MRMGRRLWRCWQRRGRHGGGRKRVTRSAPMPARLRDGTAIEAIKLSNAAGSGAGAHLRRDAAVAGRARPRTAGSPTSSLGYDTAAEYEAKPNFFGVTVGRYANRIAGGRFTLDGANYQLPHEQRRQLAARRRPGLRQAQLARRVGRERPSRASCSRTSAPTAIGLSRQAQRRRSPIRSTTTAR